MPPVDPSVINAARDGVSGKTGTFTPDRLLLNGGDNDLSDLATYNKSTVVGALNELQSSYARTPRNRRVAVIGDSIAYGNSFTNNTGTKMYAKGYLNWAAFLSRQRFIFRPEDNFGVAGNTTTEVLPRVDAALAASTAGTFIIDCLTNDEPNGVSIAQSKINYQAIIDKILAKGLVAVCITPRPRDITASGLTMTANQYLTHLARRDYVLSLHNPGKGIYVVDMWGYIADKASTNGAMLSGYTYDGVHPSVTGAYWCGLALAEVFGLDKAPGLFPYLDVLVAQNTDQYNAASFPRGCLNTNPLLTGGTTTATGYTAGTYANITNTLSKVSSGNKTWQQVQLSGTPTSAVDTYHIYQDISASKLAIGDKVEALCEVEIDSVTGLTSLGLALIDAPTFSQYYTFLTDSTDINALQMPNVALKGVMRTPIMTLPSTSLRVAIKGRTIANTAVATTFRVGALSVRKIID